MKYPYLTKLWFGRWWIYIDTKRMYRSRKFKLGWWCGIVSYRKSRP